MASLKKDHENWWVKVVEELEVAVALGNSQKLLELTYDTAGQQTSLGETVFDRSEESLHGR